ncbi:MAG TPA: hypothetical protein VG755_05125 [Nannocystaceae bacterium]|nr:hypothetical protein [Nannocystaceae bacterium]
MVEAGEDCDDGDESATCDADCTSVACGDGTVNAAALEECDAADAIDGDGCDVDCTLTRATAVATGGEHTCVLLDTGLVRCWGGGLHGQLGLASIANIGDDELPSSVGTLDLGALALDVHGGYFHGCARLEDGDVRCWGDSTYAQLGYGDTATIGDDETPSAAGPVDLGGVVTQLATGYFHSCAVLEGGDVRCWGGGTDGQLGYGGTAHIGDDELPSSVGPVDVGGVATRVTAGFFHSCALLEGGDVRCWGSSPDGQAGHGDTFTIGDDEVPSAVPVLELGGVALDVVAGGRHTCALLEGGEVRCWGVGFAGELGYGNAESIGNDEVPSSVAPVDVGGTVVQLAAGFYHTCALLDTGEVRCWGLNVLGELGLADVLNIGDDESPSAVDPIALGGVAVQIASSNDHTCAVLDDGTVRCWGLNGAGQLGYGDLENIGDDETPAEAGAVPIF